VLLQRLRSRKRSSSSCARVLTSARLEENDWDAGSGKISEAKTLDTANSSFRSMRSVRKWPAERIEKPADIRAWDKVTGAYEGERKSNGKQQCTSRSTPFALLFSATVDISLDGHYFSLLGLIGPRKLVNRKKPTNLALLFVAGHSVSTLVAIIRQAGRLIVSTNATWLFIPADFIRFYSSARFSDCFWARIETV